MENYSQSVEVLWVQGHVYVLCHKKCEDIQWPRQQHFPYDHCFSKIQEDNSTEPYWMVYINIKLNQPLSHNNFTFSFSTRAYISLESCCLSCSPWNSLLPSSQSLCTVRSRWCWFAQWTIRSCCTRSEKTLRRLLIFFNQTWVELFNDWAAEKRNKRNGKAREKIKSQRRNVCCEAQLSARSLQTDWQWRHKTYTSESFFMRFHLLTIFWLSPGTLQWK